MLACDYKKFVDIKEVSEWEVLTDKGFKPIKKIGKTVPYKVYNIKTERGKELRCADTHLLIDSEYDEVYVKDLNKGTRPDSVQTKDGVENIVEVTESDSYKNMFDLEVDDEKHRYYTNGILSHNSIFLCNDAANFVRNGKNVLFITCEMSDKKVIKRIGSNILDINIDDYDNESLNIDKMSTRIKDFRNKSITPLGKLYIKQYPTSCCTTIDIENYIKEIQDVKGFKVDVVVIDYINILSNYRNSRNDDMYIKIKQISEDLRAVAVRQNCLILTATQTNRSAFDSNDISITNIAESAGLLHTADTMLGIIQDTEMRYDNKYRIKILKIRDGYGKNNKIEMDIDYKKMKITESGTIFDENGNEITLAGSNKQKIIINNTFDDDIYNNTSAVDTDDLLW